MKEQFESKHVALPVIHVEEFGQALENAHLAKEAGADGVFLINMQQAGKRLNHVQLNSILRQLRKDENLANFWIGVNYLDLSAAEAFARIDDTASGLWTDDLIYEPTDHDFLYFGGVDFKYQRKSRDIEAEARESLRVLDVVTTSGEATGVPPEIEKIKLIRAAIGDFPLAIASGITAENVGAFLPYVNYFLFSTSVLKPATNDFDRTKLEDLVSAIRT